MSDQTSPYSFGTLVWYKAADRIWWPGEIVDPKETPEAIQEFLTIKRNPIGIVYFETDKYYDVIINMKKVCLYSCEKKMEFIKKGYNLYLRQLGSGKKQPFDMSKFVDDVLLFERKINGDLNIFKQFEVDDQKYQLMKEVAKELFNTSKVVGRKSSLKTPNSTLPSKTPTKSKTLTKSKTPTPKSKKISTATKYISSTVNSASYSTVNSASSSTVNSASSSTVNSASSSTVNSARYLCSIIKGCNYSTDSYQCFKRHMSGHKNNDMDSDQMKPSTSSGKKSVSQNKGSKIKPLFKTQKKTKKL